MDALILSCSTGGGHNSAAAAVKEELIRRGHHAVMMDPYKLAGGNWDKKVGNSYVNIAQKTPRLFGAIYKLGDEYRKLPIHSPVYAVNRIMLGKMQEYLESNRYDVIFTTHIFPGEILAYMKNSGVLLPKRIFIATDYVCVPFTEEIDCDYYVTPSEELKDDFLRRGISCDKLIPAGIPVKSGFLENTDRNRAASELGLDAGKKYILLSGGSIGAGLISKTLSVLLDFTAANPEYRIIVICGNNKKLFQELTLKYGGNGQIILLGTTDKMALYMKACEAFLSKPGGLSSTEAAVSETPLIHISPIPGCENKNMEFFERYGMSIAVGENTNLLIPALNRLKDPAAVSEMKENQRRYINKAAASDICRFTEKIINGNAVKEDKSSAAF